MESLNSKEFVLYSEKYSHILGLLSVINIVGLWFYYKDYIEQEGLFGVYFLILLILSLTQFIIYITYFVYQNLNESKTANIVLGESSAWLLFSPLLIFSILYLLKNL